MKSIEDYKDDWSGFSYRASAIVYGLKQILDEETLERVLEKAFESGGRKKEETRPILDSRGEVLTGLMTDGGSYVMLYFYPSQASGWLNVFSETKEQGETFLKYFKDILKPTKMVVFNGGQEEF